MTKIEACHICGDKADKVVYFIVKIPNEVTVELKFNLCSKHLIGNKGLISGRETMRKELEKIATGFLEYIKGRILEKNL